MSDRLVQWLEGTLATIGGTTIELTCKGEVVEEFAVDSKTNFADLVDELNDAAQNDCDSEGRSGGQKYTIVMVGKNSERAIWPGRMRRTPSNTIHMAKMVTDLHAILTKTRKDDARIQADMLSEFRKENAHFRKQQAEFFLKLESMRSKELERRIALEEHEKEQELRERVADVAIPALMAVAQGFVGVKGLPPADLRALALREIARAMQPEQAAEICALIQDPSFGDRLADAVDGKVDVEYFLRTISVLDESRAMALFQLLNPGQQASLQAVLKASS
jgi:hypothetical protein